MSVVVSKARFARLQKASPSLVSRWLAKGMPEREDGQLDWDECVAWLADSTSRDVVFDPPPQSLSFRAADQIAATAAAIIAHSRGATRAEAEEAGDFQAAVFAIVLDIVTEGATDFADQSMEEAQKWRDLARLDAMDWPAEAKLKDAT